MRTGVLGLGFISMCALISNKPALSQCTPTVENTRSGGNMLVTVLEHKPVGAVHGIVQDARGYALPDVLVEVYDHPEVLTQSGTLDRAKQSRVAGCVTGESAVFSLKLRPGEYELRFIKGAGWDVTSYSIKVTRSPIASRRRLIVALQLGT